MWRGAANEEGRDMWKAWETIEGRKVVAQVNDGNVDSLIACHSFELGLLLMTKMHKRLYWSISGVADGGR